MESFPVHHLELPHLKELQVGECEFGSSAAPFFAWMVGHLPSLESLDFTDIVDDDNHLRFGSFPNNPRILLSRKLKDSQFSILQRKTLIGDSLF